MSVLDLRGERGRIHKKEAEELFKNVLNNNNTNYEKLILSTRSYHSDASEILCSILLFYLKKCK